MDRRAVGTGLYAGLLFTALGLVAWASGEPFIFPSLGPSAYVLAFRRRFADTQRTVIGAHAIGGAAGLLAYTLFGHGATVTAAAPPLSPMGLRLAASGVASVVLTSWGMMATDTNHPPACATTLIVSLGLLPEPRQVAVILVAVVVLVEVHRAVLLAFRSLVGATHPVYQDA